MRYTLTILMLAVVASLGVATSAEATILAYDGIDYGPLVNLGKNPPLNDGGFGWDGGWEPREPFSGWIPSAGSLVGPNPTHNSFSTGNKVRHGNSRDGRALDTAPTGAFQDYLDGNGFVGKDGTTLYLSFLQQVEPTTANFYAFEFHRRDPNDSSQLDDPTRFGFIGDDNGGDGDNLLLKTGAGSWLISAQDTNVHLMVLRIDYLLGGDKVTVYRDPTGTTEPVTATLVVNNAGDMSMNGITLAEFKDGQGQWTDEIRFASTFAGAIGVPEPGTLVLLLSGVIGLLACARRRRN